MRRRLEKFGWGFVAECAAFFVALLVVGLV